MIFADHSVTFRGERETAWKRLVDWKNMPEWDVFMESVSFPEPVGLGSVGTLNTKDGHTYPLKITSWNPPQDYKDEFPMMGSRFIFFHEVLEKTPGEITVHIIIEGEGILAFVFQYAFRNAFKAKMPLLMDNFKQLYEIDRDKGLHK